MLDGLAASFCQLLPTGIRLWLKNPWPSVLGLSAIGWSTATCYRRKSAILEGFSRPIRSCRGQFRRGQREYLVPNGITKVIWASFAVFSVI
jgi:hypothetical protein